MVVVGGMYCAISAQVQRRWRRLPSHCQAQRRVTLTNRGPYMHARHASHALSHATAPQPDRHPVALTESHTTAPASFSRSLSWWIVSSTPPGSSSARMDMVG
jgi:hypothetical protein